MDGRGESIQVAYVLFRNSIVFWIVGTDDSLDKVERGMYSLLQMRWMDGWAWTGIVEGGYGL